MAAVVELLPPTNTTSASWNQATDSVVDVSAYERGAIVVCVQKMTISSGTTSIKVMSGVDNVEGQYVTIAKKDYTVAPTPLPALIYFYLDGSSDGAADGTKSPGFARYLRLGVTQTGEITFSAKATLKP